MSCNEDNRYDLSIKKGDDESLTFRWLTDDVPVDLTGASLVFECEIPALTHNMTIAAPATLGEFTATFARGDTVGLTELRVGYEIVKWSGAINASPKSTVFWGSLYLEPEVVL